MTEQSRFEQNMNPEQIEAIRHTDGPCVVMATAGSGKSRALVHRIARLVADGVHPEKILAVTFSKAGAQVMNERLTALGVTTARVGTWHSLCLEILKKDRTPWSTWQVDDRSRFDILIKEVLGFRHMKWTDSDPKEVGRYISLCKLNLEVVGSDEAIRRGYDDFGDERFHEAYGRTQQLAMQEGVLPFDDFLVFAWQHLTSSEEVRRRWAAKWQYVLQDEAQDAAYAQVEIARLLGMDHRNYMVVGDPSQAIFGFAGANPKFILDFEKEWGARTIVMNRNYRSGSAIIQAANAILAPATLRLPADMIAERGTVGAVSLREFGDAREEGEDLAEWAQGILKMHASESGLIAVLYRTNAQSRAAEESLLRAQIPYKIIGGVSFYERREVKNLLAYLRAACGQASQDDIRRCINAPFRYLGNAFLDRIIQTAIPKPRPLDWVAIVAEVAQQAGIQRRQVDSAAHWAELIEYLRNHKDENPANLLHKLVQDTRYLEWLKREEGEETSENSQVDNVQELIRIAREFKTCESLLAYVDEVVRMEKGNRSRKGSAPVVLMNCHKSKGAEFEYVYLIGVTSSSMPHIRGDEEEERRLMYVAVTRAREQLVIGYYADKYDGYSPYIDEIREALDEQRPLHGTPDSPPEIE